MIVLRGGGVRRAQGDHQICPICGNHAETFLPFGVNRRENALCPHCNSLERHRLLWLYLKERTSFFTKGWKVLDVAPVRLFSELWSDFFGEDYFSIDLESPVAKAKMDLTDLKFPDGFFNCIICYHVLEHIPEEQTALAEIARVLRDDGFGILQVPIFSGNTFEDPSVTSPKERERLFGQADHVRRYGTDYGSRLEANGFKVTVDPFVKELDEATVRLYGLQDHEDIYLVRK